MLAKCLFGMGNVHLARKELDDTLSYVGGSLAIREEEAKPRNDFDIAACVDNMGNTYYEKGDMTRALQCANRAVELLRTNINGDRRFAAALHNLGVLHQINGDLVKARKYFEEAVAYLQDSTHPYLASDPSLEWNKFKRDYNKQYATTAEEAQRRNVFTENVNRMRTYQKTHPDASFTMAISHLTDRRIEELVSRSTSFSKLRPISVENSIQLKVIPESLDWRTKGVVTPARDEGLVGEIITAIVSTELAETLHAINTKNLIRGSVGRTFDCCPQPIDAFDCIKNMSGICRETDYPTALGTCETNKCKPFSTFDKINRLTPGDEETMLSWIQDSTLWAELDAMGGAFPDYKGGIYDDNRCSKDTPDHVLQIVGYGTEEGKPYWICKNSWGLNWGESGYIRIARGKNTCGIAQVVVQVADTKKSSATLLNTLGSIFTILNALIIYRKSIIDY
ncbi:unnamed protein product [Rotaria socialis]